MCAFIVRVILVCLVTNSVKSHGHDLHNQVATEGPYESAAIVYKWKTMEYEWPNASMKEQYVQNGKYIPKNSAINGIKIYKGKVYATIPRLKSGVPSTLNVIVEDANNITSETHLLRPFPSWDMQKLGDCHALQLVQGMEIDIETGWMWVVDTGFVPHDSTMVRPLDACAAKLVIFDLERGLEVHRYVFPKTTVGSGLFYLNDIVLGYSSGSARYAFISDTLDYKLVIYDYLLNISYTIGHQNMGVDPDFASINISGQVLQVPTGINGIAMSPDFKYLYYSSVAGINLYRVSTSILMQHPVIREDFFDDVKSMGRKASQGDGMAYGVSDCLYYSALGKNAVYKWDIKMDQKDGKMDMSQDSQMQLASDPRMDWVDTLAFDGEGYLWFTTNNMIKFIGDHGVEEDDYNFFVWKIYINDYSYLDRKHYGPTLGSSSLIFSFKLRLLSVLLQVILAFHW
ncbi:hypothetical protein CHS0354_043030 [Potamilus streckersoni]|uniref:Uncharacterized protein n=1 Tax=Potamilus streckersoni TaxID=2493646 RepID=A0AAE0VTK9_9BIVA|nr:hypothetical protein CHS0354_043030 [Potamilus streckersoni]